LRRERISITIDCVGQAGREGGGFGVIEVKVLGHLPDMGPCVTGAPARETPARHPHR
jgi:hypothetical protein